MILTAALWLSGHVRIRALERWIARELLRQLG